MSHESPYPEELPPRDSQEFLLPHEPIVRPVRGDDLEAVGEIVREWVRDPAGTPIEEEISDILSKIKASTEGNPDRRYLVAQSPMGQVMGVMGLTDADEEMRQYAQTERPLEIVNAFVAGDQRGQGVGRTLATAVEQLALESGGTELIVNSGPRYKDTAWEFYNRLFGPPVVVLKDRYGPGNDALVWRKELTASPR